MKNFAISNLAFGDLTFDSALRFLQANRIEGLELAPTLIWKDPELATREERKDLKNLV